MTRADANLAGERASPLSFRGFARVFDFAERERNPALLVVSAAIVGLAYVLVTFDVGFLLGTGSFWNNPRGPWLLEPTDTTPNVDALGYLVGYRAFLNAPWRMPIFLAPDLGPPPGTSIIFVDAMPIASLIGKIFSELTGSMAPPFGVFTGVCFVLSAVMATFVMIELGQRSLLAAVGASLFALSLPALLHRFGHFPLYPQFLIIGGLWLYLLDLRPSRWWAVGLRWGGWLGLALLTNIYLTAMVGAFYAASLARRILTRGASRRPALFEAALVVLLVVAVMAIAGHFARGGASGVPFGFGFGHFSMNLVSPIWPQRSGLFPPLWPILDATGGQYEGFNYLGFGALLMIVLAIIAEPKALLESVLAHRWLVLVLAALTLFAISNIVSAGDWLLFKIPIGEVLYKLAGIFRSSGRMFWPVAYVAILLSLVVVLRFAPPVWRTLLVTALCVLQLIDTEPLRSRTLTLSRLDTPPYLNRDEWVARARKTSSVYLFPTYLCLDDSDPQAVTPALNLELQYAAMIAGRPVNSVYNPRLATDCAKEARQAREGPWREDALYVFMHEGKADNDNFAPPTLSCTAFAYGTWCMGPRRP